MHARGLAARHILSLLVIWPVVDASSPCGSQNNNNARDDDDDSDSQSHRAHSTSSTSSCVPSGTSSSVPQPSVIHDGVSKGAVAGIVVGVVFGMAALGALGLWLWMRQRRNRRLGGDGSTVPAVPTHRPDADSEVRLLADAHPFIQSPASLPPIPLMLPPYPMTLAGGAGHAPRAVTTATTTMRNLARSASISSLPNPHDPEYDATRIPPISHTNVTDRDLPPLPESTMSHSSRPLSEESSSYLSDLSRGQTYTSRHTTATTATRMSLHDEMAQYQKRLEVHHEKEMSVAQNGGGSGLPADPPPVYREEDPPM